MGLDRVFTVASDVASAAVRWMSEEPFLSTEGSGEAGLSLVPAGQGTKDPKGTFPMSGLWRIDLKTIGVRSSAIEPGSVDADASTDPFSQPSYKTLPVSVDENPVAKALFDDLVRAGVTPEEIHGPLHSEYDELNIGLAAPLVYDFIGNNLDDPRVQSVIAANPEIRKGLAATQLNEGQTFGTRMATYHNSCAARAIAAGSPNAEAHLAAAIQYDPMNSARYMDLGGYYLKTGNFGAAAVSFRAAKLADKGNSLPDLALGQALFGAGDFSGAREAYTRFLEEEPNDAFVLGLRLEADQHLVATLTDPDEIASVEAEMQADRAMITAKDFEGEKARIEALVDTLRKDASLTDAERKELAQALFTEFQQYLFLADAAYESPSDAEFVRGRLQDLAGLTINGLAAYAKDHGDERIRQMAPVYEAYGLLVQGKEDEALAIFRDVQERGIREFAPCPVDGTVSPEDRERAVLHIKMVRGRAVRLLEEGQVEEAEKVLSALPPGLLEAMAVVGTHDRERLRGANLLAVKVWKSYLDEGTRMMHGQADTTGAQVVSFFGGDWDGTEIHHEIHDISQRESRIIARVEDKMSQDPDLTALGALDLLAQDETVPEDERKRIQDLLSGEGTNGDGDVLGYVLRYAEDLEPDSDVEEGLLRTAYIAEAKYNAAESAFMAYDLAATLTRDEDVKRRAHEGMETIQEGGFGHGVMKVVYSYGLTQLAFDAVTGRVSLRLGKLAYDGWKGSRWGKRAALVGTVATVNFAGGTLQEAYMGNASEVFTFDHLSKSYGAHLVGAGLMLGSVGLARNYAPRMARGVGLAADGGADPSRGGKVFVWGVTHAAGFGGTVTSTQVAMGLDFRPDLPFGEAFAQDVVNYGIFSHADRLADIPIGRGVHADARVYAEKWAKKSFGESWKDLTPDQRQGLVNRRADYLMAATQGRPGFSSKHLSRFIEKGDLAGANAYLKKFGLRPLFSPHQELGIMPPKVRQAEGPTLWDRLFNPNYDILGNVRDPRRFQSGMVRNPFAGDATDPMADTQPGAKPKGGASGQGRAIFATQGKQNFINIPDDAKTITLHDKVGKGSVTLEYDTDAGLYRVRNDSNRIIEVELSPGEDPHRIPAGGSGVVSRNVRVKMGNSWYWVTAPFRGDLQASPPTKAYTADLPAHGNDLPDVSGEIPEGGRTEVVDGDPTVVDEPSAPRLDTPVGWDRKTPEQGGTNPGRTPNPRRQEHLAARQVLAEPVVIETPPPPKVPKTPKQTAREEAIRSFEASFTVEITSNPKLAGKSNVTAVLTGVDIDAATPEAAAVAYLKARSLLREGGYQIEDLPTHPDRGYPVKVQEQHGDMLLKATDPITKTVFTVRIGIRPDMITVNNAPAVKQILDPLAELPLEKGDVIEVDWQKGLVVVRDGAARDQVVPAIEAWRSLGFEVTTTKEGENAVVRVKGRAGFAQGLGVDVDFTLRVDVASESTVMKSKTLEPLDEMEIRREGDRVFVKDGNVRDQAVSLLKAQAKDLGLDVERRDQDSNAILRFTNGEGIDFTIRVEVDQRR